LFGLDFAAELTITDFEHAIAARLADSRLIRGM
jgi:hypothetical protein